MGSFAVAQFQFFIFLVFSQTDALHISFLSSYLRVLSCMSSGLLLWSRKPIDLKRNFAHFVHLFLDFAFSFPTNGANSIANVGDLCPNET